MTKRAIAVIGASLGDEGKGLVTDWLCTTNEPDVVVRFNGGAQAGHTCVTPEGQRHVFHHFGSGTFLGISTYLSKYFICNPILFLQELRELEALGLHPRVYAHPDCLVTTFADMMINQRSEDHRKVRHGSCGVGIHETMVRSEEIKLTMADLWQRQDKLYDLIGSRICWHWMLHRTGEPFLYDDLIDKFIVDCKAFANYVEPASIEDFRAPIFEGAQGLLLSQDRSEYFPHVTHSYTGMRNVRLLCAQAGIDDITPYYVSRTYLTRHGAGFLPGEDPSMCFEDKTNVDHPYQGKLRFAPLNYPSLMQRCREDARGDFNLVLTHCDQYPALAPATAYSCGETRNHVSLA